jgi:hypothetical protein
LYQEFFDIKGQFRTVCGDPGFQGDSEHWRHASAFRGGPYEKYAGPQVFYATKQYGGVKFRYKRVEAFILVQVDFLQTAPP